MLAYCTKWTSSCLHGSSLGFLLNLGSFRSHPPSSISSMARLKHICWILGSGSTSDRSIRSFGPIDHEYSLPTGQDACPRPLIPAHLFIPSVSSDKRCTHRLRKSVCLVAAINFSATCERNWTLLCDILPQPMSIAHTDPDFRLGFCDTCQSYTWRVDTSNAR